MMRSIFIFSVIFFLSSTNAQRTCVPGTFRVGTTCMTCPPGTYSPAYNRLSCTKCPRATFRSKPGAKSRRQCAPCAAGTASKQRGAASCTPCEPGTDSLPRSLRCRRCPAGYELANVLPSDGVIHFSGCKKCAPNYFAPEHGSNFCSRCPAGTIALREGSTQCMKCPPGTSLPKREDSPHFTLRCRPCAPGSFSDESGSSVCKICPTGSFSKRGASVCKECPRNRFNNRIPARDCQPCPAETSTAGRGAAACKQDRKDCPFGTFEDKRGVCKACSPGEKLDPEQRICVPCEENEISEGGATTICQKCPPGKVPLSDKFFKEKFQCVCAPGTVEIIGLGCVPCPTGSFWVDRNFDDTRTNGDLDASCDFCEPGTFADKPGSVECKKCPLNTFSDVSGSDSCQPCPRGYKSPVGFNFLDGNFDRTTCVDEETGCAPGELFAKKGGCITDTCPSRNQYFGVGLAHYKKQNACLSCGIDQKVVIDSSGIQTCDLCGLDEYSPEGASTSCTKCPAGQVQNLYGNSRQVRECVCKDGTTLMNGRCVETCPRGWASSLIFTKRRQGVITIDFGGCARCADVSPRFIALSTGTGCVECPKNMISVNSTKCIRCPKGEMVARNLFGEATNVCRPT